MSPSRTMERPAASARDSQAASRQEVRGHRGSAIVARILLVPVLWLAAFAFRIQPVLGIDAALPLEPQPARGLGVEVVFDLNPMRARERLRARAHQQVMVGVLHHRLRDQRRRAHALDAATAPARFIGPCMHERVELDDAVGVRQGAVADAGLERIELRDVHAGDERVEHVLALGDQPERTLHGVLRAAVLELEAGVVGDDHRAHRALDQDLGRRSRARRPSRAGSAVAAASEAVVDFTKSRLVITSAPRRTKAQRHAIAPAGPLVVPAPSLHVAGTSAERSPRAVRQFDGPPIRPRSLRGAVARSRHPPGPCPCRRRAGATTPVV